MYRQLRGLGALGAGECPSGFSYDGSQCQPDAYDCTTSGGQRGKLNASGWCDYILQPSPYVKPGTTKTPASTQPAMPSNFGAPCMTPAGPGKVDAFGACFFFGEGGPCGNGGVYDSRGNCLGEKPKAPAPQPAPPPVVPQPTPQERNASCKQKYGANSAAVMYQGEWVCSVCNADEILDPTDGACWCGPDKVRSITGDTNSPCVPKLNPQPAPPPEAQASMGKAFFAGAVVLGILGLGLMLVGSREDRA